MRAAIQTGIRTVEMRDIPEPSPDDVNGLVRVRTVGICGSDLHPYHARSEAQTLPAGHTHTHTAAHLLSSMSTRKLKGRERRSSPNRVASSGSLRSQPR